MAPTRLHPHLSQRSVSRRAALLGLPFAFAARSALPQPAGRLTAREVIERIKKNVSCSWQEQGTVDVFKAGDPDTPLTGIATTFTATMDVLRRAAAAKRNLIITHEPTFYNHTEQTADIEGDSVLAAKRALIAKHGLVVWRFHDHWHRHKPDGVIEGMIDALGWRKFQRPAGRALFLLPPTTVGRVASDLRARFKANSIRVVGDPEMKVTKAGFSPGSPSTLAELRMLQNEEVELLVAGEVSEWAVAEYTRDAAAAGKRKALLLLGHAVSEEAGMENCARWLRTFVKEVAVEFTPAGEPFWSPK